MGALQIQTHEIEKETIKQENMTYKGRGGGPWEHLEGGVEIIYLLISK